MDAVPSNKRRHHIVVLGGGFGGVYTTRRLMKLARGRDDLHITLISRDNYFLMTPLLFEAGSGVLEPRHAVTPIRPLFEASNNVRFIGAEVEGVDFKARAVQVCLSNNEPLEVPYEQIIIALGSVTNTDAVPGAEHAMTFKEMRDALFLRNHVIDAFERADVEPDPARKRALTGFCIVGGGLVGVELMGELSEFVKNVRPVYKNVRDADVRFYLIEHGSRLMPEMDESLAEHAKEVFERRGVVVRALTSVDRVEPGRVHIKDDDEPIDAETIVVATGVKPAPLVAKLDLPKGKRGHIVVESTMRTQVRPEVWALGDCAQIPDPGQPGKFYPPLAQHALREARRVADNVVASIDGRPIQPFVYKSKGTLASLGQFEGVGRVYFLKITGFLAWWVWRSYYLLQMPQFNRKVRLIVDWTVALFFSHDVAKLDPAGIDELRHRIERPRERQAAPVPRLSDEAG